MTDITNQEELRVAVDELEERAQDCRLAAVLLCDHVNQTNNGKYNLSGIFDAVGVRPPDYLTPMFFLFVKILNPASDARVDMAVTDPTGAIAAGGFIEFEIDTSDRQESDRLSVATTLKIAFMARLEGQYWISVLHNDEYIGGTGLKVTHLEAAQSEAPGDGEDE